MGRSKRFVVGGLIYAEWWADGALNLYSSAGDLSPTDLPAFIEWLQAGPPKQYRITKVFDFKPDYVSGKPHYETSTSYNCPVEESDIEEIPCSG